MKTNLPAIVSLVGLLGFAAPGLAGEGMAKQYKDNLKLDACEASEVLADFLVAAQTPAGTDTVGWTWQLGQKNTAPNMAGLVSLALLDAYETTGKLTYLRAAQRYGDGFLDRPYKGLPYKSDLELMVRLYGLFDDSAYSTRARTLFDRILEKSPTGDKEVARIADGRKKHPALLGYDVALAIRAALSVDERRYAYQLADELIARSGSWYKPKDDSRYTLVSAAAMVSALESLDRAHYGKTISKFRKDLARAQQDSGAWLNNESQSTAHALHALLYSPVANERQAAQKGVRWLISTLLKSGSLGTFNDHMPEPFVGEVYTGVNAEALTALAAACKIQKEES